MRSSSPGRWTDEAMSVPYAVVSCAIRFTSWTPRSRSDSTSAAMDSGARLRRAPLSDGTVQYEHRLSQPSAILT